MGKTPCCEKDGLKKGPWTPEEDEKLIGYIQKHGHGRWRTLPKNAGLKRCGKSCRLRWSNYLRPDIKRGRFSFEEEETIIQLHSVLGNKWSAIAARLPGRTDNEIKNYWNTHIRKRLLKMGIDPVTHTQRLDLLELSSLLSSSLYNPSSSHQQIHVQNLLGNMGPLVNQNLLNLATTLLSYHPKTTSTSTSTRFNAPQNVQEINPLNVHQNQFQSFQPNVQPCTISSTTSNTSTVPSYLNDTQFMQLPKMDPLSESLTSCTSWPDSSLSNMWQNSVGEQALFTPAESYAAMASTNGYLDSTQSSSIVNSLSENQAFVSSEVPNNIANMSFSSLLSTPSSSPHNLYSSSATYANSKNTITHEDERDSFCSNMFLYSDIANYGLNGNEFV